VEVDVRRDDRAIEGLGEAIVDMMEEVGVCCLDVADHWALSCM
jgi:hypothetical protein